MKLLSEVLANCLFVWINPRLVYNSDTSWGRGVRYCDADWGLKYLGGAPAEYGT